MVERKRIEEIRDEDSKLKDETSERMEGFRIIYTVRQVSYSRNDFHLTGLLFTGKFNLFINNFAFWDAKKITGTGKLSDTHPNKLPSGSKHISSILKDKCFKSILISLQKLTNYKRKHNSGCLFSLI